MLSIQQQQSALSPAADVSVVTPATLGYLPPHTPTTAATHAASGLPYVTFQNYLRYQLDQEIHSSLAEKQLHHSNHHRYQHHDDATNTATPLAQDNNNAQHSLPTTTTTTTPTRRGSGPSRWRQLNGAALSSSAANAAAAQYHARQLALLLNQQQQQQQQQIDLSSLNSFEIRAGELTTVAAQQQLHMKPPMNDSAVNLSPTSSTENQAGSEQQPQQQQQCAPSPPAMGGGGIQARSSLMVTPSLHAHLQRAISETSTGRASSVPLQHSNLPTSAASSTAAQPSAYYHQRVVNDGSNGVGLSVAGSGLGGGTQCNKKRYKTEMCRRFLTNENNYCEYGDKCQYAHGLRELRLPSRHKKYKSELCTPFHKTGICPYGRRCDFIHNENPDKLKEIRSYIETYHDFKKLYPGIEDISVAKMTELLAQIALQQQQQQQL